jgi:MATE family multidrug resistance protein
MLGSAAQNIIVLCDNVFLYHVSDIDFAAVGLVGVFYLLIASIGYGFSRGGQVLIARRHGERDYAAAGDYFKALVLFELAMAIVIFLFLYFGSAWFFSLFIDNPVIYEKCLEYIYPRSFGVFFSYVGVSFVAFYTGVAKTRIIIYDTVILIVVNIILNYMFIYGKFGFEPMGIAGAGLASTLAEVVAFVAFVIYMLFDKSNKVYKITGFEKFNVPLIKQTFDISAPIVWQSIVGLGSWFIFFALIENMGSRQLEISNLIRNVYLILSIPCWGYSAGINTLVSNYIGNRKRLAVIPIAIKTAKLNLFTTLIVALPVVIAPEFFLHPLFGEKVEAFESVTDENSKDSSNVDEVPLIFDEVVALEESTVDNILTVEEEEKMSLIKEAKPLFPLLLLILAIFSIGSTFMNALTGTGHTKTALWIQSLFVGFYILYSVIVIKYLNLNLHWAWGVEVFYWIGITAVVWWYLKSKKWHVKRF